MAGWHRYGNDMILQHTTAELNTWMLTQRQIQKNTDWTKVTYIVTPLQNQHQHQVYIKASFSDCQNYHLVGRRGL